MNKTESVSAENVKKWFKETFSLPDFVSIDILEEEHKDEDGYPSLKTNILVKTDTGKTNNYTILKPLSDIRIDDIIYLKKSIESYIMENYPLRSRVYKFFGWWFIFASSLAFFSVCPICGQTGCPVGIGTTGIIAGTLSLLKTNGKQLLNSIISLIKKAKNIFYN